MLYKYYILEDLPLIIEYKDKLVRYLRFETMVSNYNLKSAICSLRILNREYFGVENFICTGKVSPNSQFKHSIKSNGIV